ncbi:hypothetical protein AB0I53_03765 [Saccharopolyspora sp. NPDC050389]|uniref:hypothetical protein n=1 Tax=Saccharopolyspora sp. NPDC050389 TaxID=3155516 RepID=UPI0033D5B34E
MDTSSSDVARLLRIFAARALVLAFIAGVTGITTLAMVLALVGVGLLLAPVETARRKGVSR